MVAHLKHPNDLFIGNKTGTNNYILTRSDKIFFILCEESENQAIVTFSRQDNSSEMVTNSDIDAIKELFFVNTENIEMVKANICVSLIQRKTK